MVLSTDTTASTPDALPDPESKDQEPTGSPFHVNIARWLTGAAGLGAALLIATTFLAGWHSPASSGHVSLLALGMILSICGYLGALWARGQHRRKAADEKNQAILLQSVTKAVRAICVETAQESRRIHHQTLVKLMTDLEEDTAHRSAAVEVMRRELSGIRSVVAGTFTKTTVPLPVWGEPLWARDLVAKVDALAVRVAGVEAQAAKTDDDKFLKATADAFELGQQIARNRPDADRG